MPSGMRRVASVTGMICSVFCFGSFQFGLYFKVIHITEVSYQLGSITFTCSSLAASCMSNMMVFWFRHIVTALWNPTSLTVIKSKVISERISKVEARILYAAYHLKEAARYLEEDNYHNRKEEVAELRERGSA
jgi:hypothetical protein